MMTAFLICAVMKMKRGMLKQFNCSEFAVDGEVSQLCGEMFDAGSRAPWQRRLFEQVYFLAKNFITSAGISEVISNEFDKESLSGGEVINGEYTPWSEAMWLERHCLPWNSPINAMLEMRNYWIFGLVLPTLANWKRPGQRERPGRALSLFRLSLFVRLQSWTMSN